MTIIAGQRGAYIYGHRVQGATTHGSASIWIAKNGRQAEASGDKNSTILGETAIAVGGSAPFNRVPQTGSRVVTPIREPGEIHLAVLEIVIG